MKKVVQIIGACRVNKGDRLMVKALEQKLEGSYYLPVPVWLNTPASRFWSLKNISLMFLQGLRRAIQHRKHGKPDIILDCSGYQYGDPWAAMGKVLSMRLLMYQHFRAGGARIVLLPQTLGPFTGPVMASTAAGVFRLAEMVFARDEVSRSYALDAGCPAQRLKIAPDYSNIAEGIFPADPGRWADRACIVPSIRMIDKTAPEVGSAYINAMQRCIELLRSYGTEPFILVHQPEDRQVAERLKNSVKGGIMIVDPPPAEAKGIIASSRMLVGSRYHALVSALSQAIPAIGTGWTHKYRALFEDYECEDLLVENFKSGAEIEDRLGLIIEDAGRARLTEKLRQGSARHKARTLEMFSELDSIIGGARGRQQDSSL